MLTITIGANQVATGLSLTIFASGLSAFVNADYVGIAIAGLQQMNKSIPLLNQDIVVYLSIILVILVWWFMRQTRLGLVLACVGESPEAADALGLPVVMRYGCGNVWWGNGWGTRICYLWLAYTLLWAENMTAGRGWIAIAYSSFCHLETD